MHCTGMAALTSHSGHPRPKCDLSPSDGLREVKSLAQSHTCPSAPPPSPLLLLRSCSFQTFFLFLSNWKDLSESQFCVSVFVSTGLPLFMAFCFIARPRYCIFHKLQVRGDPVSRESVGAIFPTALARFLSLLIILAIFQTSSLLFCLLW